MVVCGVILRIAVHPLVLQYVQMHGRLVALISKIACEFEQIVNLSKNRSFVLLSSGNTNEVFESFQVAKQRFKLIVSLQPTLGVNLSSAHFVWCLM